MISMNIVAEEAIQRFNPVHSNVEWAKGGDYVGSTLSMDATEVEEWITQLGDVFAHSLQ
jgi:hypothetical protein